MKRPPALEVRIRDSDDYAQYVDAAARFQALPISEEHRAAVIANFTRLAQFAALVAEHGLDVFDESFRPDADPAP